MTMMMMMMVVMIIVMLPRGAYDGTAGFMKPALPSTLKGLLPNPRDCSGQIQLN